MITHLVNFVQPRNVSIFVMLIGEGLVSWEIVQGATVTVSIKEVGVLSRITIPAAPQARVFDLLTP